MKYAKEKYEDFEFFEPDDINTALGQKVVKTRKPHLCQSGYFDPHDFGSGTFAVRESAITPDGFGTNYICIECADKILDEYAN